jgi:molybdate transport system substrate-binding protein
LTARLAVLSAGAAQAALTGLAARLGIELQAEFGAVAAMRRRFLDGVACDVLVLTRPMIEALASQGQLESCNDLGSVQTAIAVRESDPLPDVSSADRLRAALLEAQEIYYPDPERATAGIHFAGVLKQLGVAGKRCTFASGAAAMRGMAAARAARVIGCTQETEIRNTPGAKLVAALPAGLELSTVYSAGITRSTAKAELARSFVSLLRV